MFTWLHHVSHAGVDRNPNLISAETGPKFANFGRNRNETGTQKKFRLKPKLEKNFGYCRNSVKIRNFPIQCFYKNSTYCVKIDGVDC